MLQRRPRFRSVAITVALVSVFVFFPSPSSSAAPEHLCPTGALCVWEHKHYKGCYARLPQEDKNWDDGRPAWENCRKTMNDKVSSYMNRTTHWAGFWMHKDRKDLALCVTPGGESPDLDNLGNPESYEDEISSHWIFAGGKEDQPSFFYPDGGYCYVYDND